MAALSASSAWAAPFAPISDMVAMAANTNRFMHNLLKCGGERSSVKHTNRSSETSVRTMPVRGHLPDSRRTPREHPCGHPTQLKQALAQQMSMAYILQT